MYAPLCQYITSLLSSTPPPSSNTSPLKVRVEYSCGSVEYTTACSTAKMIYQAVKGLGCTLRSFNSLSLDDFISAGAIAARRCLKQLSLAPYYAAQMKRCMQKWDRWDDQGASSEAINVCWQLVSIVSTGIYHSMADVQYVVRLNCGSGFWLSTDRSYRLMM